MSSLAGRNSGKPCCSRLVAPADLCVCVCRACACLIRPPLAYLVLTVDSATFTHPPAVPPIPPAVHPPAAPSCRSFLRRMVINPCFGYKTFVCRHLPPLTQSTAYSTAVHPPAAPRCLIFDRRSVDRRLFERMRLLINNNVQSTAAYSNA